MMRVPADSNIPISIILDQEGAAILAIQRAGAYSFHGVRPLNPSCQKMPVIGAGGIVLAIFDVEKFKPGKQGLDV